ncbi:hypothetical protein ACYULU_06450 [Breznakiellaceae bacterium SP9]
MAAERVGHGPYPNLDPQNKNEEKSTTKGTIATRSSEKGEVG